VGENDARPRALLRGVVERVEDRREVVAAEIGDERGDLVVARLGEEAVERRVGLAAGTGDERLPHGRGGQAQQPLILGVRHGLEPSLEAPAPGPAEEGAESPAPAEFDDAPAAGREHRAELTGARIRNDTVERLAVHVHDPEDAREIAYRLLAQRLPDVALVELGVTHHDDDAPRTGRAPVVGDVARRQRAERRLHGAEPHRAGGDVHDLRVLPPARIRLETAEGPELRQ